MGLKSFSDGAFNIFFECSCIFTINDYEFLNICLNKYLLVKNILWENWKKSRFEAKIMNAPVKEFQPIIWYYFSTKILERFSYKTLCSAVGLLCSYFEERTWEIQPSFTSLKWNMGEMFCSNFHLFNITSVSKKPGQTAVVIHYYSWVCPGFFLKQTLVFTNFFLWIPIKREAIFRPSCLFHKSQKISPKWQIQ